MPMQTATDESVNNSSAAFVFLRLGLPRVDVTNCNGLTYTQEIVEESKNEREGDIEIIKLTLKERHSCDIQLKIDSNDI